MSPTVYRSSTFEFEQYSSTSGFEQSRRSELEKDVRESFEPCAVCRCSVADVEATRHDVASDTEQLKYDDNACEGRESDAEFHVAAVPSEAPSLAVLRRRPRHRDVIAPSVFYRASATQSETRRCTPAAVAQVAAAAAVARSVVSMLRLYVVCLVCFF